jgi:hypothetical protein
MVNTIRYRVPQKLVITTRYRVLLVIIIRYRVPQKLVIKTRYRVFIGYYNKV